MRARLEHHPVPPPEAKENPPLRLNSLEHQLSDLLATHQHTAENWPHAETAAYAVGRHTRDEKTGINLLGIVYRRTLALGRVHTHLTGHTTGRSLKPDPVLTGHRTGNFAIVARCIQNSLGNQRQRIHMETLPQHRRPVHHHATDASLLVHNILHRVTVENSSTRLSSLKKKTSRRMHRINDISTLPVLPVAEPKLPDNRHRLLLHNDIIKHHCTAPHTAARRQLAIQQRHLAPGLRQIIRCHDTRGTAAHNSGIQLKAGVQLCEIRLNNTT